jgi:hypothetical protein
LTSLHAHEEVKLLHLLSHPHPPYQYGLQSLMHHFMCTLTWLSQPPLTQATMCLACTFRYREPDDLCVVRPPPPPPSPEPEPESDPAAIKKRGKAGKPSKKEVTPPPTPPPPLPPPPPPPPRQLELNSISSVMVRDFCVAWLIINQNMDWFLCQKFT